MSDHLVLCVDRLITPETLQSLQQAEPVKVAEEGPSSTQIEHPPTCAVDAEDPNHFSASEEEEPLIQTLECRICQEEDNIKNLEAPCACSGSLKVDILFLESLFIFS